MNCTAPWLTAMQALEPSPQSNIAALPVHSSPRDSPQLGQVLAETPAAPGSQGAQLQSQAFKSSPKG